MLRRGKQLTAFLLAFFCAFLCLGAPAVQAAESRATAKIRVAFPNLPGFSEKSGDREYTGYTYEYLQEIAKYTGWEYEFVEPSSDDLNEGLVELLGMLERGEVDLMGGMIQNEQTLAAYDFPEYSAGTSFAVLTVRGDDTRFTENDYSALAQIRVGAQATATKRIRNFETFCESNGIQAQVVTYSGAEKWKNALAAGEVDALLESDTSVEPGRRIIARFAESPHYFATTKGNAQVISGLNSALAKIREVDIHYDTALYNKYFGAQENDTLFLSAEEQAFIAACDTLEVVYPAGWNPLHYQGEEGFAGVSATLLEQISRETGLSFHYREAPSYEECVRMVQEGEADLLVGAPANSDTSRQVDLTLTQSYLPLQRILVRGSGTAASTGTRAACLRGNPVGEDLANQKISWYDTPEECLQAVERGEVDSFVTNSYLLQEYTGYRPYRHLTFSPLGDTSAGLCLGLRRPADTTLLTVLSKAIGSISEKEQQDAIFQNTFTSQPHYSLMGLLYAYPLQSVLTVALIAAAVLVLIAFLVRGKIRSQQRQVLDAQRYRTMADLSDEFLFEYDVRADVLTVSDKFAQAFGCEPVMSSYTVQAGKAFPSLQDPQVASLIGDLGQKRVQAEVRCRLANGSTPWFSLLRICLYDEEERPLYCIGKLRNIEKERAERADLLHRSQTDGLTGLYNRRTCEREILRQLAERDPGEEAAFLLLDLDHFKSVNDQYGHQTGDDVLTDLARCMEAVFSQGVLGRLGGDEFIAYLPHCSAAEAVRLATALCAQLCSCDTSQRTGASASAGITPVQPGDTFEALYHRSDRALYQAKAKGGNTTALVR